MFLTNRLIDGASTHTWFIISPSWLTFFLTGFHGQLLGPLQGQIGWFFRSRTQIFQPLTLSNMYSMLLYNI